MPETTLITGGLGCIGAETVKWLLDHTDDSIIVLGRDLSPDRIQRALGNIDSSRVRFEAADIQNQENLATIIKNYHVNRVVHMAALQTPDCNAHRDLGLQINLAGTQNLLEAIKSHGSAVTRVLFASSIAVYGPRSCYPPGAVAEDSLPRPVNPYGVWKLAGEHLCRQFHDETGISTVAVRPAVLFGPGRDAGLTSSPTTAMKHVAKGVPYKIPFSSQQDYQYAPDIGAAVATLAADSAETFECFTFPSVTLTSEQFAAEIRAAAGDLGMSDRCDITVGTETVPFICELEYRRFAAKHPSLTVTPTRQAIRNSLAVFARQNQN